MGTFEDSSAELPLECPSDKARASLQLRENTRLNAFMDEASRSCFVAFDLTDDMRPVMGAITIKFTGEYRCLRRCCSSTHAESIPNSPWLVKN